MVCCPSLEAWSVLPLSLQGLSVTEKLAPGLLISRFRRPSLPFYFHHFGISEGLWQAEVVSAIICNVKSGPLDLTLISWVLENLTLFFLQGEKNPKELFTVDPWTTWGLGTRAPPPPPPSTTTTRVENNLILGKLNNLLTRSLTDNISSRLTFCTLYVSYTVSLQ